MMLACSLPLPPPRASADRDRRRARLRRRRQRCGQWTAFRAMATEEAVMFVPQPVKAQDFLKDKDPPVAGTGGRRRASSRATATSRSTRPVGAQCGQGGRYFTTVWQRRRRAAGTGSMTAATPSSASPRKPKVRKASCSGKPSRAMMLPPPLDRAGPADQARSGQSNDGTLRLVVDVRRRRHPPLRRLAVERPQLSSRSSTRPSPRPMIELFTTAFVTLAVIIDPPGCAPIFASLTSGTDAAHRRRDGDPLDDGRLVHPDVLRLARRAVAQDAGHQPSRASASPAASCCS